MNHKKQNGKLDLVKIKNFRSLKNTTMNRKRKVTDWEKVPPKHMSDKRLTSQMYKMNPYESIIRKQSNKKRQKIWTPH